MNPVEISSGDDDHSTSPERNTASFHGGDAASLPDDDDDDDNDDDDDDPAAAAATEGYASIVPEQEYYMRYTTRDSPRVTRFIPIIPDGETHAPYDPNSNPHAQTTVDLNANETADKRRRKPKSIFQEKYDHLVASFSSTGDLNISTTIR